MFPCSTDRCVRVKRKKREEEEKKEKKNLAESAESESLSWSCEFCWQKIWPFFLTLHHQVGPSTQSPSCLERYQQSYQDSTSLPPVSDQARRAQLHPAPALFTHPTRTRVPPPRTPSSTRTSSASISSRILSWRRVLSTRPTSNQRTWFSKSVQVQVI